VLRYLYPFQVVQQFILFIAFGTVIGELRCDYAIQIRQLKFSEQVSLQTFMIGSKVNSTKTS
jgi:hypothetical protein